jgi:hypothetical protein
MTWTRATEKVVLELSYKCMAYQIMHKRTGMRIARQKRILNISQIVLSVLTGTATFANIVSLNLIWIRVGVGIVLFTVAFLSAMDQYLEYGKLIEKHKLATFQFGRIYMRIQEQMMCTRRHRENAHSFIRKYHQKYNQYMQSSPFIRQSAISHFVKEQGSGMLTVEIDRMVRISTEDSSDVLQTSAMDDVVIRDGQPHEVRSSQIPSSQDDDDLLESSSFEVARSLHIDVPLDVAHSKKRTPPASHRRNGDVQHTLDVTTTPAQEEEGV